MKIQLFIAPLLIILSLVYACGSPESEVNEEVFSLETDSTDLEIFEQPETETVNDQVINLEKRTVVFFMISKREIKELIHDMGETYRWETEALFNNFNNQAKAFQTILKKHSIRCIISEQKVYHIKLNNDSVIKFNRIEKDQIIGQIFSDGEQQPVIEFGMYTNGELAKMLEKFYKIENLGYVPPDSTQTVVVEEAP